MTHEKPDNVVEVSGLAKFFGGLKAFEGVDLYIPRGKIVGLIGPNGAGKSTLINCITGVYTPTKGDIRFNGRSIVKMRPHQICRLGIGRTFQIPRPFRNMTVFENVKVCEQKKQVDYQWLLDIAGLWDKRDQPAKTLTFQECRLLELSRALAVNPELILLDESVAGLNPTETVEMMNVLREVHRELDISILWIEHVMKAIMENAHLIFVLHQGTIIASGGPRKIANDSAVIEAYLGEEYEFKEDSAHVEA